jgi:hypothetical protein
MDEIKRAAIRDEGYDPDEPMVIQLWTGSAPSLASHDS